MERIYLHIKYGNKKAKSMKGYILDIGKHGMGVACTKAIKKNTLIKIKTEKNILLPVECKVASHQARDKKPYAFRLGLRFVSLEREARQKLEKFINKLEKRKAARLRLMNLWKPE